LDQTTINEMKWERKTVWGGGENLPECSKQNISKCVRQKSIKIH